MFGLCFGVCFGGCFGFGFGFSLRFSLCCVVLVCFVVFRLVFLRRKDIVHRVT